METTYFNGNYIPKDDVKISPDDRGFLFADGIYEVIRWYKGGYFDMDGHIVRLKRSLHELKLKWTGVPELPAIALNLIKLNHLENEDAMLYLQVTRGAAKRTHYFPNPEIQPTVYACVFPFVPDNSMRVEGVKVMLKEDIRWSRCDVKSVSLLANTLCFDEAYRSGLKECIFHRNGVITEGSHSNIFLVVEKTLRTHPESNFILSGITRKNILKIARELRLRTSEEAVPVDQLRSASEAFITNTSAEVTPVIELGGIQIGNGKPGTITNLIAERFDAETAVLKG
jgi:D-alanine transaminase